MSEESPMGLDAMLPRRRDAIVSRALGNKLVLYNPDSREVSVLNATATAVWELCDGKSSVANAIDRLRTRFRIAESRDVAADVVTAVETLARRGLLAPMADAGSRASG